MSRTVNTQDHAEKSNAILDVAERLIVTKGYEQMTTQDILQDLQISRGAFYHYFESKAALLMALVERIGKQAEQLVRPIVADHEMGAEDKLVRFFAVLDQVKRANKDVVFAFGRVWYADENVLFRHKLYLARIKRLSPLLSQIIVQGVAEGSFTTEYPDQAARMTISLLEDLAYAFAELLEDGKQLDFSRLAEISDATAAALERLLGMKSGRLQQSWSDASASWQALVT